MPQLLACNACHELVQVGSCTCPHCGAGGMCRTAGLPAAALLMGLALGGGCVVTGQSDYAAAITDSEPIEDDDGDGWSPPSDCDDDDETIYPDAEETPGDGVDSNCDGEDDT